MTTAGGFHWKPLDENPQPIMIWKRGPELQGKKVLLYEEGGTNGHDILGGIKSRLGLVLATQQGLALEAWLVSVENPDIAPHLLSDSVSGACLCMPITEPTEVGLPLAAMVECEGETDAFVSILPLVEAASGSFAPAGVRANFLVDLSSYAKDELAAPAFSMGTLPEVLCLSLSNILVVIFRRKGLVVAFEIEDEGLSLIAEECVEHFVADGVMRFSAELGGLELVMLLVDGENNKDGRVVSFSFRAVA